MTSILQILTNLTANDLLHYPNTFTSLWKTLKWLETITALALVLHQVRYWSKRRRTVQCNSTVPGQNTRLDSTVRTSTGLAWTRSTKSQHPPVATFASCWVPLPNRSTSNTILSRLETNRPGINWCWGQRPQGTAQSGMLWGVRTTRSSPRMMSTTTKTRTTVVLPPLEQGGGTDRIHQSVHTVDTVVAWLTLTLSQAVFIGRLGAYLA